MNNIDQQNEKTNQINELPTISLVFPVRNRESYLPTFLDHIYNLDYPKHLISIMCIINDSIDNSEKILYQFQKEHEHEYNKIYIKRVDLNSPVYDSNRYSLLEPKIIQGKGITKVTVKNETHTVYKNLAKHRNTLLVKANSDFIFSVDTDIMVRPDTLRHLLSFNVDYISAHICNGFIVEKLNGKRTYDYTNALYNIPETDRHPHYPYEATGLLDCSFSGACFLASKKAYKSGSVFSQHILGEDYPFCKGLTDRGFKIYCDANHKLAHLMDLDLLEKYKRGEWEY